MYQLKKGVQGFTVIDGPMAGKSFKSGMSYKEIPPQEAARFTEVKEQEAPINVEGKPKKEIK
jgi:hypothetical protein